ncbi:MAG: hypothetical protein JOZ46_03440 [Candidatus Dormibacteraeota bacterium]|nr:hypothetical protein [Candidatus Dormibacteraeota bacterium]
MVALIVSGGIAISRLVRSNPAATTAAPQPLTVGKEMALHAVACASTTFCLAVGSYSVDGSSNDRRALVERWNGAGWAVLTAPSPDSDTVLNAVACVSSSACMAVGAQTPANAPATQAFALRWNGAALAITPLPSAAGDTVLNGIACPLERRCIAVGSSKSGQLPAAWVATWDGAGWAATTGATPTGGVDSWLNAVACTQPAACTAVGGYSTSGDHDDPVSDPLIESWDGMAWSVVPSPAPGAGNLAVLSSVACTARSSCFAVGNYSVVNNAYGDDTQALVETTGAGRWTEVRPAGADAGAAQSALQSIACSAAGQCVAVGTAPQSGYAVAAGLIATLGASGWERLPASASHAVLESVACPSRTCLVVGERAGGTQLLAIWRNLPPAT